MKDYGISFIPDINQGSKEPSEPIVSDKLNAQKVNELIDKKLKQILQDQNFQNTNIKISKTPPNYNTQAKVGEIWAVLESKKQLFICTANDNDFTSWVDLLGDGRMILSLKKKSLSH